MAYQPLSELVDWADASRLAGRVVPPGPQDSRDYLNELVESLRSAASRAAEPVIETGALGDLVGAAGATHEVLVVDRAGWARANGQSMSTMMGSARIPIAGDGTVPTAVRLAATGEVAAILSFLSAKVLGQFDPYGGDSAQCGGRLLLVAPNVLNVERDMDVVSEDFRMWVSLHELAHAQQFAAAPWLRDYVLNLTGSLLSDVIEDSKISTPRVAAQRFIQILRSVYAALRGNRASSVMDAMMSEEQRVHFNKITAVMSLLEGHADVLMDEVGPKIVPTVADLRKKFDHRRASAHGVAKMINHILGMDTKMEQYRQGAVFVRETVNLVGFDGLNAAWAAPELLPKFTELSDAEAWVRRVHG